MAHEPIPKICPELTIEEVPTFGASYGSDWKRRKGLSFRRGNTDRRPSTVADILADDEWRCLVQDVFENPKNHGLLIPERLQVIRPRLRLAADETQLHCFPKMHGTYEATNVQNAFIAYGKEIRQVTRTSITDAHDELFLF